MTDKKQIARKALKRMSTMLFDRLHEEGASDAKFTYLSNDEDILVMALNSLNALIDPAEAIEKLEGLFKPYPDLSVGLPDHARWLEADSHNRAIKAARAILEGESQ